MEAYWGSGRITPLWPRHYMDLSIVLWLSLHRCRNKIWWLILLCIWHRSLSLLPKERGVQSLPAPQHAAILHSTAAAAVAVKPGDWSSAPWWGRPCSAVCEITEWVTHKSAIGVTARSIRPNNRVKLILCYVITDKVVAGEFQFWSY